jgi:hypothetical protein
MPLSAQGVSYNQEFQINSNIASVPENQQICVLKNKRFVICWMGYGSDGSGYGVFARLFDVDGSPIGTEFQVNTYTEGDQWFAKICALDNGCFVICWESYGQDGSGYGIFAKIYDANGKSIAAEFKVNTTVESDQRDPRICTLEDNCYVISWISWLSDGSGSVISFQLFNANGEFIGEEIQENTYSESHQKYPQVCILENGCFVICWGREDISGWSIGVFARIYNSDGQPVGEEFQVDSYTGFDTWDWKQPKICALKNNRFIICWKSSYPNFEIVARLYESDGKALDTEFSVNTNLKQNQTNPQIQLLGNDQFLICWTGTIEDKFSGEIFARLYNLDGDAAGPEFRVNEYIKNWQYGPNICLLENNRYVICWESFGQDGSDCGIFARMYDVDGKMMGTEFQINTYIENDQRYLQMCNLGNDCFFICWVSWEQTNGFSGLYGKYYLADPIAHTLHLFQLHNPENDAYLNLITPSFQWQEASGVRENFPWELTYDLYIAINNDFTNPILFTDIQDTMFTIPRGNLLPGTTYYWKVLARNIQGDNLWSSNVNGFYIDENVDHIPVVESDLPIKFILEKNFPNPFNPTTIIPLVLAEQSRVTMQVYNTLGQMVATLAQGQIFSAGRQQFTFDGNGLAGGVYFVRTEIITAAGERYQFGKKMLMIK